MSRTTASTLVRAQAAASASCIPGHGLDFVRAPRLAASTSYGTRQPLDLARVPAAGSSSGTRPAGSLPHGPPAAWLDLVRPRESVIYYCLLLLTSESAAVEIKLKRIHS